MEKPIEPFIGQPDMFGQIRVNWQTSKGGKLFSHYLEFSSREDAEKKCEHLECMRIINLLQNYTSQHLHICAAMSLSNAGRKKPLSALQKTINRFNNSETLERFTFAGFLYKAIYPVFTSSLPGRSSRFYNAAIELQIILTEFINTHYTNHFLNSSQLTADSS